VVCWQREGERVCERVREREDRKVGTGGKEGGGWVGAYKKLVIICSWIWVDEGERERELDRDREVVCM
jgi:hypothetical protein